MGRKLMKVIEQTIIATFDYINEASVYIIASFVFINEAFIYRLEQEESNFSLGGKQVLP